jgi:hypothetical protein
MMDVVHDLELPAELVERLPARARKWEVLRAWWASLAEDDRAELGASWVAEDTASAEVDDGALAVLLEARFVEPAGREAFLDREDERLAKQSLREWIEGHPEQPFFLAEQLFHICRAHPKAREAVRAGFVPADFSCPLANEGCPMRRLLAVEPGCSVVLSVVGVRGRERAETGGGRGVQCYAVSR